MDCALKRLFHSLLVISKRMRRYQPNFPALSIYRQIFLPLLGSPVTTHNVPPIYLYKVQVRLNAILTYDHLLLQRLILLGSLPSVTRSEFLI